MQKSIILLITLILLTLLAVSTLFINFSCAPPAPKIDAERQKAIDDSIRKAAEEKYKFELMKTWSTGFEYHKAKMYRNALAPFWKVAEMDTIQLFKTVWNKLVDCYFNMENPDSALIAAELGLQQYPDNLYLHRSVAHLYSGLGQTENAIEHYQEIVKLDPKAAEDWKKLGSLYLKEDLVDDAIVAYETVTELNPNDAESNDILSKLYAQTGNEEAALVRLEKLRQQEPDNPKHMFNLGRQYFIRQLYEKAEPEFREYVKYNPDDLVARDYLGASLQNQGKYQEAINVYNSIVEKDPNNKKSLCEIGSCLKFLNNFSQARSYANRAIKIDAEYGFGYIVRGETYEAAAEYCMDKAGRTSPNWDDKLVYELALKEYQLAERDPAFKDIASRKMSYVQQMIPTTEDRFMHRNETQAKDACYKWIY